MTEVAVLSIASDHKQGGLRRDLPLRSKEPHASLVVDIPHASASEALVLMILILCHIRLTIRS